jgi:hypothetical protein
MGTPRRLIDSSPVSRRTLLKGMVGSALVARIGSLPFSRLPAAWGSVALSRSTRLHPTWILLLRGIDGVDGRLIVADSSNKTIRQSVDWGATWSGSKGVPAGIVSDLGAGTGRALRFGNYIYLQGKDAATGRCFVYRTPPAAGNTAFSWQTVLKTYGTALGCPCMNADGSYIYCGEYGDPSGGPRLYRSADGVRWDVVFGPSSYRHIHYVASDPYHPGHVWMAVGDGVGVTALRSTAYGAAGTWSIAVPGSKTQSVQLSFDPTWVWLGADSAFSNPQTAFVIDRGTLAIQAASTNYHANIPVPQGTSSDSYYNNAYFGAVDPATGIYYCVTAPGHSKGNTQGMFFIDRAGGTVQLLDPGGTPGTNIRLQHQVFIAAGRVWSGQWYRPLLT